MRLRLAVGRLNKPMTFTGIFAGTGRGGGKCWAKIPKIPQTPLKNFQKCPKSVSKNPQKPSKNNQKFPQNYPPKFQNVPQNPPKNSCNFANQFFFFLGVSFISNQFLPAVLKQVLNLSCFLKNCSIFCIFTALLMKFFFSSKL